MVVVTTPTGHIGSQVTHELLAAGEQVRVVARDLDRLAASLRGKVEVIHGSSDDQAVLIRALAGADALFHCVPLVGVDAVFYIAPAFLPDEAAVGVSFVDAVRRSGARRLVFSSVIHPVLAELPNHAAKAPVEAAVLNSGLEYTFLHPTLFFQNYAGAWPNVLATGVLVEPWSTDTRFTRIDYRDVAEVAAIALTEDRLLHGTFELCAEGSLNRKDVALLLSDILVREIKAVRVDPNTLGDQAKPMRPMFAHYEHHDLLGNALTIRAILGREPRTLRAYFEELASRDQRTSRQQGRALS